jgi:hypothetical protein
MNRVLWTGTLTQRNAPAWPCPTCRKGTLNLVPKSLIHKETVESSRAQGHPAWDPDWTRYTFTAWVRCGHAACNEEFAVSGTGGIGPEYHAGEGTTWEPYFTPKFSWPTLDIFDLPAKCPDEVKAQLRAGFALFWSDPPATASRVRVALERLMDHVGVAKRRRDKTGKFLDLTLHSRIELFQKGEAAIGSQLMALKWLGNTGSHDGTVTHEELLDAFEILEHALAELIDRRSAKVAALARMMSKKHARGHR